MIAVILSVALAAQFDFDLTGAEHWDGLGMQVFFLDDLTGDGVPEFGCGSFCTDLRDTNSGSVLIFDGYTRKPIRRHDGYGHQARLGETAMACGDLDGDGYRDYMGSARNETVNGLRRGAVYVWSGLSGDLIHFIPGREKEGHFGRGVAALPDMDGDGVPDLAIGAPHERDKRGVVGIFSGATGSFLRQIRGPEPKSQFGYSLTAIGDINGDNVPDLAIGAPYHDEQRGGVYFHSGFDGTLIYSKLGAVPNSRYGWKVVDVGDVNLDSRPEVLIGEPCTDTAFLVTASTGNILRSYQGQVNPTKSGVGHELAAAGDVDGDGYPDYVVGHPGEWDYNIYHFAGPGGGVTVLSGRTGMIIASFPPYDLDDGFGSSVAVCSDPNPIGPLILIGSPAWGDLLGGDAPGMISGRIFP